MTVVCGGAALAMLVVWPILQVRPAQALPAPLGGLIMTLVVSALCARRAQDWCASASRGRAITRGIVVALGLLMVFATAQFAAQALVAATTATAMSVDRMLMLALAVIGLGILPAGLTGAASGAWWHRVQHGGDT